MLTRALPYSDVPESTLPHTLCPSPPYEQGEPPPQTQARLAPQVVCSDLSAEAQAEEAEAAARKDGESGCEAGAPVDVPARDRPVTLLHDSDVTYDYMRYRCAHRPSRTP